MDGALKCYTLLLLFIAQPVMAFEGDYIWEERFQASLFSAKDGNAQAQLAVAEMYHKGRGTEASDKEALHWFLLVAEQGNVKAAYKAAYIYLHSDTVPQSPQNALLWLQKSADAGYPPAQYELGLLYETGLSGHRDSSRALSLLGKAKLAGYKPAIAAFDQLVGRLVKMNSRRLAKLLAKSKPVVLPNITKASLRPKVTDQPNLKRMILGSRWDGRNGPSTFLPSRLTNCHEQDSHIECMSSTLTKKVASAEVTYRIRTRITDIQNNGRFRLAYANKVLSATNDTGTRAMQIKTGWQLNEHTLDCSLASQTIRCSQGASRQYRFTVH